MTLQSPASNDPAVPAPGAQRKQRARRLARSAWSLTTLLCLTLAGVILAAMTDDPTPSRSTLALALLGVVMIALLVLVTRLHVQHVTRLTLQAAVIERQNMELRSASQSLKHEIDEREQAESQRDSFFNLSADLLAILDGDGRFVRVNPAFADQLGVEQGELRTVELTSYLHEQDVDEFRRALESVDEGTGAKALEARCRTKRGHHWFLWTLVARGRFIFVVAHDFSAHRAAADALREAKEAAELANDTKTQFLANMSHELRTPLNAVIGFSQTLGMGLYGPLTEKQLEYVNDINRAGEHLLGIVTDLLDLSVIDSGAMVINESGVKIGSVIDDALALVKTRAEEAGVELGVRLPQRLPLLRADAGKIRQILVNFLGNAIKFTPRGGRITVSAGIEPQSGGFILEVMDTGIGIKPVDIPQVLSPFGRLKSAYARSHGGVGLGLPLAKRLAELHEGDVALTSEPGRGTTVRLWLPPTRIIEVGDSPQGENSNGSIVHQS